MAVAVALIDDDDAVLDSTGMMLSSHGFELRLFRSAKDFLVDFQSNNLPACIVCDILMPDMSGIELQTELQKSGSHVPIIMITGQGRIDMAISAIKRGAQDF